MTDAAATPPVAPELDPTLETVVEHALEELDVDTPRVGIVMDAESDMPALEPAARELEQRDILHEVRVMSAQHDAGAVAAYAKNAQMRGLAVLIVAAAPGSPLPGVVAGHTELPVIGVPLADDALLALAAAPPDAPVACVGVDRARSAAVLAARILTAT
ncbi:MAG TPA: AIR carboxylase family protein [Solirubrobacteraceae bacterium]|jgi:phosphoribosylaminoimidazole carboxylase PurE protein